MIYYFLFILNIAVLSSLVYWSYKKALKSPLKKLFWPALILKLTAGILLGVVYRYYYDTGDTWQYFNEGVRIASITEASFWDYLKEIFFNSADYISQFNRQPRALFISKITSCFALLTGANYWLISIYFSFFSFIGFWFLAENLQQVFKNKAAIGLSLLFFPSVVFWSSGLSKESLAMIAITIVSGYLISYFYKLKAIDFKAVLLIAGMLVLLWKVKYYYAGVFILAGGSGVLVYLISSKVQLIRKQWGWLLLSFIIITLGLTVLVSLTRYNFHFSNLPEVMVKNYQAYLSKSSTEQMVMYEGLKNTWSSIINHSPKALFSGLFRPLPGDGTGLLSFLPGIENLVLIILTISVFFALPSTLNFKERLLLITSLVFITVLATFLTLSAPNFGTLVRYKIAFLPILLLIISLSNPLIKRANRWVFGE